MASIQKRGNNSYLLVVEAGYFKGKRNKKTKTIRVEDPALLRTTKRLKEYLNEELLKFKIEVEAGEYIAPEKMIFSSFVDEWRAKYGIKKLSPTTIKVYNDHLKNHILPAFGDLRLDQIKTMQLVNYIDSLCDSGSRKDGKEGSLSDGTIGYIHKILRNIFKRAVEWKLIKENPMEGVSKPTVKKKEMKFYEEDEAIQVMAALFKEPIMWRMCFLTAMFGGMRRGELVALEWTNVNFEDCIIKVDNNIPLTENGLPVIKETKGGESRFVDMPKWYMEELKQYYNEWITDKENTGDLWEGGEQEYLFHSGLGKPLYYNSPTQRWGKFIKKHDLKPIRLHDLRHTMVTLLIEAGENLKAIQKRAGHSSHAITADTYAHVTKKLRKGTAAKFDKFDPKIIFVNN